MLRSAALRMPTPPPMTGKGLETLLESLLTGCERLTGGRLVWHRHEPKMAGKTRVRGGLPDYEALYSGRAHLIECKHTSDGSSVNIGRLTGEEEEGVSPKQARELDRHERAGGTGWVLARLELNATTRRRLAQARLDGTGADMPPVICRLIPWPTWRALMAAAEDARRRGHEPDASVPAADLAAMGWPCRDAGELLAAIRGS